MRWVAALLVVGAGVRAEDQPERIGAAACLTCHENRGSFHDNIHARAWPRAKKIEFEESCETCHGPGSLHAAAAGDRTNAGFATIRGPAHFKSADGAETCLQCHAGSGRMHWVGSVHERRNVGCASCHDIHDNRKRLLTADTEMETCVKCHQNMRAELKRNSHHPIVEGKVTCSDCHNPHGTAGPKLLVGNAVNETCFKCHTEKRGPFLWEHRPVSEACTTCHLPHGSVHNKLMRERLPYLCQSCHSVSNHPGTMYAVNPVTPGKLPGQKLNNRTLYRACLDCHANIHGSNHPSGKTFTR